MERENNVLRSRTNPSSEIALSQETQKLSKGSSHTLEIHSDKLSMTKSFEQVSLTRIRSKTD
jgi:hypothetical protein